MCYLTGVNIRQLCYATGLSTIGSVYREILWMWMQQQQADGENCTVLVVYPLL